MTATIYAIAAITSAALATRAWLHDRDAPERRALMWLGWLLAVGYVTFALAFLPGLDVLRAVWTIAGGMAPIYAYAIVEHMFPPPSGPGVLARTLPRITWPVAIGAALVHGFVWGPTQHASPPEMLVGAMAVSVLALVVRRLRWAREEAALEVERTRIGWLAGITMLATTATVAEWLARYLAPELDTASLPFLDRGLVLQGRIPPFSALLATAGVYLLYHAMAARRLMALQELAARMAVVGVSSFLLLLLHALTTRWVALSRFPLHASFLLLLVSAVFLSVYGSSRAPMRRLAGRWFNPWGQALAEAVEVLERDIPTRLSAVEIAEVVAARLHGSGRFQAVAVYLYDGPLDAYRRTAGRGTGQTSPLEAVAARPFVDGLDAGMPLYDQRTSVEQLHDTTLALMEAMDADTILPLRFHSSVLGWLALRDEVWSDGFSGEELEHLAHATRAAALTLRNVESFRRMEEERRLATLGTLSAGLAHEIRNPLAGLKGAAQVLQGADLTDTDQEMAAVIVEEADRLDSVVTQFLDYARPFQLHPQPLDLQSIVSRVSSIMRAAGLPEGVSLVLDSQPHPPLIADGSRLTQVLLNLVRNAVEATREQGGTVHIRTRGGGGVRAMVELMVEDDGSGIPPEHRAQLFTPFFTTRPEGTGLGLPICKRIVEAHGGELDVRHLDPGTAFVARLPTGSS